MKGPTRWQCSTRESKLRYVRVTDSPLPMLDASWRGGYSVVRHTMVARQQKLQQDDESRAPCGPTRPEHMTLCLLRWYREPARLLPINVPCCSISARLGSRREHASSEKPEFPKRHALVKIIATSYYEGLPGRSNAPSAMTWVIIFCCPYADSCS